MSDPLSLFPARIAIGMFIDASTRKRVDVTMTPEFFRALRDVLAKLGGSSSDTFLTQFSDVLGVANDGTGESGSAANETTMIAVSLPDLQAMITQAVAIEMSLQRAAQPAHPATFEMVMAVGEPTDPTPPPTTTTPTPAD